MVESRWLLSPRLEPWQRRVVLEMQRRAPLAKDTVWILSSGTQSVDRVKALGLSEAAILHSAASVNRHLQSQRSDRWLLAIPHYHIGGLSIFARAHLLGAKVIEFTRKWNAHAYVAELRSSRISLSSLVPTQIFDLVTARLSPPDGLRAIVVGGGSLAPDQYIKARALGWPLLPSYGLTECSSQVATAGLETLKRKEYPKLKILPHVKLTLREGRICLQSKALARWIAVGARGGEWTLESLAPDGWFLTEDLARLSRGYLEPLGRQDNIVKIFATMVNLNEVEEQAREFFLAAGLTGQLCVVPISGGRAGTSLLLVTESKGSPREWALQLEKYNRAQKALHRFESLCFVEQIPTSELNKVLRRQLMAKLKLDSPVA